MSMKHGRRSSDNNSKRSNPSADSASQSSSGHSSTRPPRKHSHHKYDSKSVMELISNKNLKFEEELKLIPNVIKELETSKSLDSKESLSCCEFLTKYDQDNKKEFNKWISRLIECEYIDCLVRIGHLFRQAVAQGLKHQPHSEQSFALKSTFCVFNHLYDITTDKDCEIVKPTYESRIPELCLQILDDPQLLSDKKLSRNEFKIILIEKIGGVLLQSVTHSNTAVKHRLRQSQIIAILRPYLHCDVPPTRLMMVITLSHVIDEEQMTLIDVDDDVIRFLVNDLLKESIKSEDRMDPKYGCACVDNLVALNALAKHDCNKRQIVKEGAIPILYGLVERPNNKDEFSEAMKGLWLLSFIPEGAQQIRRERKWEQTLDRIKNDPNRSKESSQAATGALLNLRINDFTQKVSDSKKSSEKRRKKGRSMERRRSEKPGFMPNEGDEDDEEEEAENKVTGHVMISYNWNHQNIAKRINDKLKSAKYKTWIDVEQMRGSTLDAMAAAVEQSFCVIMCWSEPYQDSINCRAGQISLVPEAEYAFKLNKQIVPVRVEDYQASGWLNLILGSKLYVVCENERQLDDRFNEILNQFAHLNAWHTLDDASANGISKIPVPNVKKPNAGKPLNEWTNSEVQKWLRDNNLSQLKGPLSKFNGNSLHSFRQMHRDNPQLFYDNSRHFLNINELTDLMLLTEKMELI